MTIADRKFSGWQGQLTVAVGSCGIGLFFLIGASFIPDAAGYSTVGPTLVPRIVGAVLALLGALLAWEVWRGGFRNHDEAAERALPFDWPAFAMLTAGIIGYGLLIERAGFIIASVYLFLTTAAAFGSRRWVLNGVIALVLAAIIFGLFNYGLGLNLPKGILEGVL
jgi:putative tricarboxylic transport membrane protein